MSRRSTLSPYFRLTSAFWTLPNTRTTANGRSAVPTYRQGSHCYFWRRSWRLVRRDVDLLPAKEARINRPRPGPTHGQRPGEDSRDDGHRRVASVRDREVEL